MQPYAIASYPRSGSTWLRFILCNLLLPGREHTFDTVNHFIPPLDDPVGLAEAAQAPLFHKTHQLVDKDRVIWLHRHVGDVALSEWWYKRKFHADVRTLEEYLEADNFGEGWRRHADHFHPCPVTLRFDQLDDVAALYRALVGTALDRETTLEQLQTAMDRSGFTVLQKTELEKGLGRYPTGDPAIRFIRNGSNGQWKTLQDRIRMRLLEANRTELARLGYS